jgi:hypothetical protein
MERLREAREFAQWSKQHRAEQDLPKLTDEQDRQLRKYLQLIEDHGWNKSITMASQQENGIATDCEGCPVMNFVKDQVKATPK